MKDNIPESVKSRRLAEIISTFHEEAHKKNMARVGQKRELVLVDGPSKRDVNRLRGRTDGNHKVIFDQVVILDKLSNTPGTLVIPQPGDYVEIITTNATSTSFQGVPLARTSLVKFNQELSTLSSSSLSSSSLSIATNE
jgi:tRNA A37 methylthiotransferase MiaB